jgi:hypothetical protein
VISVRFCNRLARVVNIGAYRTRVATGDLIEVKVAEGSVQLEHNVLSTKEHTLPLIGEWRFPPRRDSMHRQPNTTPSGDCIFDIEKPQKDRHAPPTHEIKIVICK